MLKSTLPVRKALRLGADYVILLGLSFFICGLGAISPTPRLLG